MSQVLPCRCNVVVGGLSFKQKLEDVGAFFLHIFEPQFGVRLAQHFPQVGPKLRVHLATSTGCKMNTCSCFRNNILFLSIFLDGPEWGRGGPTLA